MGTLKFKARKQYVELFANLFDYEKQLKEEINVIDSESGLYGIDVPFGIERKACEADIEPLFACYGIVDGIHYDFIYN